MKSRIHTQSRQVRAVRDLSYDRRLDRIFHNPVIITVRQWKADRSIATIEAQQGSAVIETREVRTRNAVAARNQMCERLAEIYPEVTAPPITLYNPS